MAFDERLAARIRARLGKRAGVLEKKMFGGVAFLLNGHMCCGVYGSEMIVRLDPGKTDDALSERHTRVFDITGRPMKGWILVGTQGLASESDLKKWIGVAAAYAGSLPPKAH